jgi:hypothetical protein
MKTEVSDELAGQASVHPMAVYQLTVRFSHEGLQHKMNQWLQGFERRFI